MMKQTLILLKLIRKPCHLTSNHKEKDNARNIQKTNSNWNTLQHKDKNNSAPYDIFSNVFNSLCFKLKCTVILHLKTGSLGYETIR